MNLAQIINGEPVAITGQDVSLPSGASISVESLRLWTEAERNAEGFYTINEAPPAPEGQITVSAELQLIEGVVHRVATYEPVPLEQVKAQALSTLAAARWDATQFFTYDGVRTQADGAIGVIAGRLTFRDETGIPPEEAMNFKLADGEFRGWTRADEKAFGVAIAVYIQACFDVESTTTTAIKAAADVQAVQAALDAVVWPA